MKKQAKSLSPEDYVNNPEVQQCINDLKAQFGNDFEKLEVSDTLDGQGNQYVNLVQKGGGVLGVALVGYTYILEKVGIRFLRMAGTSAGAINTSMIAAIGEKHDPKSEKILDYLCKLDFFQLVDGHPFARWLIRNFITHKKFEQKVKTWLGGILGTFFALILLDIIFLGLQHYYHWTSIAARATFILTGFNLLLITAVVVYTNYLLGRLRNSGYGINPGMFFYNWIKDRMEENGVKTVSDLNAKAGAPIPGLRVRKPDTQNVDSLQGDVTFITAELVTQNKIEFPRMCQLFRENPDDLHPARFVRASMSIPVFFESHVISDIPVDSPVVQKAWNDYFGITKDLPQTTRFVDGGMLSNFPINIFYNPKIIEPRLPSFGIDLDDSDPTPENSNDALSWPLGSFIGRMFNTIRFYYDKDFLLKNKVFEKGVGKIPLSEFNWLNFFLSDDDKMKMFVKGAKEATRFLMSFDWAKYQHERTEMQQILNEKNKPEEVPAMQAHA